VRIKSKHVGRKVIPGAFSIRTFSLVYIYLQNGGWYPKNLKCVMYIRIIVLKRHKIYFLTTYHIDVVFHASFGEGKCCQFSTNLLRHQCLRVEVRNEELKKIRSCKTFEVESKSKMRGFV
jgi:hypothetical protein